MSLSIQVKGPATDWMDVDVITTRNVTGNAVVDQTVTSAGKGNQVPGVLLYTITALHTNYVNATCQLVLAQDSHHPSLDDTGISTMLSIPSLVKTTAQIGDQFIIAAGYSWNESNSAWMPVRSFGIILPGQTGSTLSILVTSSVNTVFTQFAWSNTGPGIFEARVSGDAWRSAGESPIYLRDSQGVDGLIGPDATCTVEIRPQPDPTIDNSNNMVVISMTVSGYSV
jgi:hypothetical protein